MLYYIRAWQRNSWVSSLHLIMIRPRAQRIIPSLVLDEWWRHESDTKGWISHISLGQVLKYIFLSCRGPHLRLKEIVNYREGYRTIILYDCCVATETRPSASTRPFSTYMIVFDYTSTNGNKLSSSGHILSSWSQTVRVRKHKRQKGSRKPGRAESMRQLFK